MNLIPWTDMNIIEKLMGQKAVPEKPEKEYRIVEETRTWYRVERNYSPFLGWLGVSLFFDSIEEARAYIEAEKSPAPAVEPKVVEEL